MNKHKNKRNFWLTSEIGCMLDVIKEVLSHQGSSTTTLMTFVQIATKMKKRGFPNKSPTQIRRKWFQMKSAYLCYKRKKNTERLLLIPEQFRDDIAKFVDTEYKVPSNLILNKVALPDFTPKVHNAPKTQAAQKPLAAPTPPVACVTRAKHTVVPTKPVPRPPEKSTGPTIAPVRVKEQPNHHERDYIKPNLLRSETFDTSDYYEQRFDEFLGRVRVTHAVLNRDFRRMQESLMEYEHHNQAIRDDMMMSFLRSGELSF